MTGCSVILPTKNRRESLAQSLAALGRVEIPDGWLVELIVVDNGSTDRSRKVAEQGRLGNAPARVLSEPAPGVSRARNLGARASTGEVLLFLDDDMRPPKHWLEQLARPIVEKRAVATVSQFKAGEGRDRSWMTNEERGLFVTEHSLDVEHPFLVGGSMAISRPAFDLCGGFEEGLGPGVLGAGGEDLLLTYQLQAQGLVIMCVPGVVTEHWFDESKLTRAGIRERRIAGARSDAWLAYHWFGRSDGLERPKALLLGAAAVGLRVMRRLGIGR